MGVVTDGYNQVASQRQLSPAILTLNITTSTCCLLVTPLRARDMSPTACCARPVALAFAVEAPNVSLHTRSVGHVPLARRPSSRPHGIRRRASPLTKSSSAKDDTTPQETSTSDVPLQTLISQLRDLAGTKNGTDLDEAGVEKVKAVIEQIINRDDGYPNPNSVDLTSTNWQLTYSDSKGNSSGKLGPFTGVVTQEFTDEPGSGKYKNVVKLVPLVLSLAAVAEPLPKNKKNESLKVTFVDLTVTIFGQELLNKPFPPDRSGTWRMAYASDEIRVLYTNQGNVFVLTRT